MVVKLLPPFENLHSNSTRKYYCKNHNNGEEIKKCRTARTFMWNIYAIASSLTFHCQHTRVCESKLCLRPQDTKQNVHGYDKWMTQDKTCHSHAGQEICSRYARVPVPVNLRQRKVAAKSGLN